MVLLIYQCYHIFSHDYSRFLMVGDNLFMEQNWSHFYVRVIDKSKDLINEEIKIPLRFNNS